MTELSTDLPPNRTPSSRLCKCCSKVVSSYISQIQQVLENLTEVVCKDDENTMSTNDDVSLQKISNPVVFQNADKNEARISDSGNQTSKPTRKVSRKRNNRRLSKEPKESPTGVNYANQQDWKLNFMYDVSQSIIPIYQFDIQDEARETSLPRVEPIIRQNNNLISKEKIHNFDDIAKRDTICVSTAETLHSEKFTPILIELEIPQKEISSYFTPGTAKANISTSSEQKVQEGNDIPLKNTEVILKSPNSKSDDISKRFPRFETEEGYPEHQNEQTKHSIPFCEKKEISFLNEIPPEAFVTLCRNNAEALGCLVVGYSLLLCRTSKKLCVLIFDGVSTKLQEILSSIFHVAKRVTSLDIYRTTEVREDQANSNKSLEKINIWRLVQFRKCVFLNPDTLVMQNCDELFQYDELSAVPDIGWPDCFNAGVFVFVPSLSTFSRMMEVLPHQAGKHDDQMLLNAYFDSWSRDLRKKLSFIYNLNLMANAMYTYAPAFVRFGSSVKIVQFSGTLKPWHLKFHTQTSKIDESNIQPLSRRFLYEWINIFRISVLRLFPQGIYMEIFEQDMISAEGTLIFLRLPTAHEISSLGTAVDFNSTNRYETSEDSEKKSFEETQIGISTFGGNFSDEEPQSNMNQHRTTQTMEQNLRKGFQELIVADQSKNNLENVYAIKNYNLDGSLKSVESLKPFLPDHCLTDSDVRSYDGMKIWEQGRMDYEGADNSEKIIKRLQNIIEKSNED